jgi:hypothetical protein
VTKPESEGRALGGPERDVFDLTGELHGVQVVTDVRGSLRTIAESRRLPMARELPWTSKAPSRRNDYGHPDVVK